MPRLAASQTPQLNTHTGRIRSRSHERRTPRVEARAPILLHTSTNSQENRMARLAGVDIPRDKRVVIALTYIYGVGRTRSNEILTATEIDENLRVKDLTDDQLIALRDYIEGNYKVEGNLRRE